MLPVAVHVPGVCAGVVVPDIPVTKTGFPNESVTDLLHPTKARRTPIEQSTKPIKTRELKKADREKELFFYSHYLKLCERTYRSRISLRKEGEVALLESPNGLGAHAEYHYAGECRTKSFAVFCRLFLAEG